MRFETFVALRYLRGKRKSRFVNLITIISVAGVSVGVIALIVVISVMTGFEIALRATIIGNRSHLLIVDAMIPPRPLEDPETMIREIEEVCPEIVASSPILQVEALLQAKSLSGERYTTGAYVLGIDPARETQVTQLAENLTHENGRTFGMGELPGEKEIVLGFLLAQKLGVRVGDTIIASTLKEVTGPFGGRPQRYWLTVSGISQAQMSEFDLLYGWVTIETAKLMTDRKGVDGVHSRLTDPFLAEVVRDRIEQQLGYRAETWYESQQPFFEALKQEKVVMAIILVFIVLVAAFNITSTLIMVVMEKRRDIGILRTIGVSGGSVLRLFVLEGLLIGLSGTFIGVALGIVLAYNLNAVAVFVAGLMGVDLFNSTIYYFDRIPVAVVPYDVAWITISAVILTFLSTLYPAWSAARLDPVDALRYE